jgi:hypothetical protein
VVPESLSYIVLYGKSEESQTRQSHSLILKFYDLLKVDILKVVRESQRFGKVLGSLNSTFISLIPKKHDGVSFKDFGRYRVVMLFTKL